MSPPTSNGFLPTPPASVNEPLEPPLASTSAAASSGRAAAPSDRILDLLYSGFDEGRYHDVVLKTPERPYRLHRLLLSQSPRLQPMLDAGGEVRVDLLEPGMTEEGFAICLQAFYSSSRSAAYLARDTDASRTSESVRLFVGVLSSAVWLGGIEELADLALEKCLESVCSGTVLQWIAFLSTTNNPPPLGLVCHAQLAQRVREHLAVGLPAATSAFATPASPQGLQELEEVFVALPWAWLKQTIESPLFPASERQRFAFAKSVVQRRKTLPEVRQSGSDEAVVLAFGGEGGNVCLTRKTRKARPLYKISA